MVRPDGHDLDRQQPRPHPVEQIVETVAELADEHQCPGLHSEVEELEFHAEFRGERGESRTKLVDARPTGELHPHEEPLGHRVAELLALDDVAIVAGQQP